MADIFCYERRRDTIGQRIKLLRKREKLSQEDLGSRLSMIIGRGKETDTIGQSTVSSWERGVTLPPMDKMIALAVVFDCDISYLLGDYEKEKKDRSDICNMTGLSEKAIIEIMRYKEQYPDYIDSLNFLLESDNFEDALFCIYEYSNALLSVDALRTYRYEQIAALDAIRDYKPNLKLLDEIRQGQEKADLCEYNLSTRFSFIVQEIKRKVENGANTARRGNNG